MRPAGMMHPAGQMRPAGQIHPAAAACATWNGPSSPDPTDTRYSVDFSYLLHLPMAPATEITSATSAACSPSRPSLDLIRRAGFEAKAIPSSTASCPRLQHPLFLGRNLKTHNRKDADLKGIRRFWVEKEKVGSGPEP